MGCQGNSRWHGESSKSSAKICKTADLINPTAKLGKGTYFGATNLYSAGMQSYEIFDHLFKGEYDQIGAGDFANLALFISPTYLSKYKGVTVEFNVNSGTTNSLIEIGVGDDLTRSIKDYGKLPQVSKGWAQNNAYL